MRASTLGGWLGLGVLLITLGTASATAQTVGFQASYENDGSRVLRVFRMWVPPETETVRGAAFVWAGAGQDWRDRAGWEGFQEAARALNLALIATMDNELGLTRSEVDAALSQIMSAAATASGHPELADAPVALMGFSQGGYRSSLATALSSGRVIGLVGHKGGQIVPLSDEGKQAPALFIAGELDGNFTPDFMRQVFQDWRNQGGRAAYAVDWGVGHNDLGNQGWEAAWYWLSEVARLRLPASPTPPTELADIPFDDGWLGDKPRFRRDGTPFITNPFFRVAPVAEFDGSADAASWLPTEGAAYMYRAFTSTDEAERNKVPFQTPLQIRQPAAFDTLALGDEVTVEIDLRGFEQGRTLEYVVVYDGADSLGTAIATTDPGVWAIPYTPDAPGIHALIVIATDDQGEKRTTFRTVIVKPEVVIASEPAASSRAVTIHPNRPNPFSHTTDIRFELASTAPVRVEVLDVLGRTVAMLADSFLPSGDHAVPFEAAGLASGVYFTRITVDGVARTRPILLTR